MHCCPEHGVPPALLLAAGFVASFVIGVPIAFVLAFCALLYFLADPTLPMLVYSQQVLSGTDHFVLLAIPFFVLAGLLMEANGMSSRLIELLVRMFGRLRGGLEPDHHHRDGVFLGRVGLEARRRRRGRRHRHAGGASHSAGPERGSRRAGQHRRSWPRPFRRAST